MALLGFSYFAIKSGYEAFRTAVILIFIEIAIYLTFKDNH